MRLTGSKMSAELRIASSFFTSTNGRFARRRWLCLHSSSFAAPVMGSEWEFTELHVLVSGLVVGVCALHCLISRIGYEKAHGSDDDDY